MFLSKRANGIYYLWYEDDQGVRRKLSTGRRLKSEATKVLLKFARKQQESRPKTSPLSLSQFAAEFLAHSKCVHAPKTTQLYVTAFAELGRCLGDLQVTDICPRRIEEFLRAKQESVSAATVRTYLTHLASAFETGREWRYLSSNPFKHVKKPKLPEAVPAFPSEADFCRLLGHVNDPDLRDVFTTAALTGMRLGELLALQWTDIDLDGRTILVQCKTFFRTKNRRIRRIAITEQLRDLLKQRSEQSKSSLVFARRGGRIRGEWVSKSFKEAVRKAGLDERLHFHSLRHGYASWLVKKGAPLFEVQKLLGHSSISVTQVYAHLAPSELHDTVSRIRLDLHSGDP